MEQGTVTISTQEYMDLVHRANINDLMFNKLVSFENRLNRMNEDQYKISNKLYDLESNMKGK